MTIPDESTTELEEQLARELEARLHDTGVGAPPRSGAAAPAGLAAQFDALRKIQKALETTHAAVELPEIPGFSYRGELGRGGMGIVMKAYDAALEREVAIKFLAPELSAQSESRDRFLKEARALARLRHPNLVAVHTAGEVQGRPFFAMELVQGTSLDRAIQRARQGDGGALPLDARERSTTLARLFVEITDALASVHRAGLLHRDIKPANILIASDGTARLADFGISADRRNFDGGGEAGTLRYMPPERIAGGGGEDGPRADVYALGLAMIEALTLKPAFPQQNIAELRAAILAGLPPFPPDATRGLDARLLNIARRAAARNAADRFADAAEMSALLRDLRGRSAFPVPRALLIGAAALLLIAAGIGIATIMGAFRPSGPPGPNNRIAGRPDGLRPGDDPRSPRDARDFPGPPGPDRNNNRRPPRGPSPGEPDRLTALLPTFNRIAQCAADQNWPAFLDERDRFLEDFDDDTPPCRLLKAWILALQQNPDRPRAREILAELQNVPMPQPVEKFKLQLNDYLDGRIPAPVPGGPPPRRNR
jgi:serine/threonine protein kinase